MYPALQNGVTVGSFTYDDHPNEKHYYVENSSGKIFELSFHAYQEVIHADGTHPLNISPKSINLLINENVLFTNRYVYNGFRSQFILVPIGEQTECFRSICSVINTILPFLALLSFIIACFLKKMHNSTYFEDVCYPLYFFLILTSVLLHEVGHFVAGVSYGYKFTEFGIQLAWIFPIGVYVAHRDKKDVPRLSQVQFSLAGVEVNLLMAAVFLLLSMLNSTFNVTFLLAAIINIVLTINLLPAFGLDGESALSALIGLSVHKSAKRFLKNKKYRHFVLHSGSAGYVVAAIFFVSILSTFIVGGIVICDIVFCVLFPIYLVLL